MPRFQKRHSPQTAGTLPINPTPTEPIEPTTDGLNSDEEQNPNAELSDLVQSVKALQNKALDELEQTMDDLAADFTARAVEIVRRGTDRCFLQASAQIREIQIGWTSDNGGLLDGNTIDTIALPGSITDGDTE